MVGPTECNAIMKQTARVRDKQGLEAQHCCAACNPLYLVAPCDIHLLVWQPCAGGRAEDAGLGRVVASRHDDGPVPER